MSDEQRRKNAEQMMEKLAEAMGIGEGDDDSFDSDDV
jgi:hypothetical protein